MKKILLILTLILVCSSLTSAKLFSLDETVTPPAPLACSIFGCSMQGDINMTGHNIYDANLVNPGLVEFDPIFTAQNGTMWQAIHSKLNITDQRYNDTYLIYMVNDSFYIELGNYYTKNESDGLYYPLYDNPAGYINESYADDSYYPLNSNPAGYITSANLSDDWVNITGDTMTGNLSMSNNSILGVDVLEVHNITGRSPIYISSPVIAAEQVNAPVFYASENVVITGVNITATTFYGNIQGSNGTIYGATINNGTIVSLRVSDSAIFNTSLIPEMNYTWSLGEPDRIWKDFHVGELYASNISSPDIDYLYNITNQIILDLAYKLNISDQRYNDTQFILNELSNYYNMSEIDYLFANFQYNETDPIFSAENATLWFAINGKLDIGDQRYNDTLLIQSVNQSLQGQIDNITTNLSYIYIDIDNLYNITDMINASIKQPSGPYIAFNDTNFWINETPLNYTINDIAKVRSLNYTFSNVSGPGGVLSDINISYQITQIIVIPNSNSTNYRFTLTEYPSGDVIDENRAIHNKVWNIRKSYSVNSIVNATITTSVPSDTFTIIIKYVTNGVQ